MRKIGIILSMALFTLFASCEKDDKKPTIEPGDRVTKLEYAADEYTSFQYNADKLLTKVVFADDGEQSQVNVSYDEQKKLKQVEGGDGFVYQFKYQNGRVNNADILVGAEKLGLLDYEYDASGNIKTITTFMKTDDNGAIFPPFMKASYEYFNDNKGNVSKITFYVFDEAGNDFELTKILEYSNYDDKINPLKEFGLVSYLLFNMNPSNNPGKMVEKDENGVVTSTSTFAYTYNSKGRPSQVVETINEGGTIETHTMKFAY
jgi:hypothetical protein